MAFIGTIDRVIGSDSVKDNGGDCSEEIHWCVLNWDGTLGYYCAWVGRCYGAVAVFCLVVWGFRSPFIRASGSESDQHKPVCMGTKMN